MTTVREMTAKFDGLCSICGNKIKAGKQTIAYSAELPVSHHRCYVALHSDRSVPQYSMDQAKWDETVASEKARWDEAVAAHAAKAAAPAPAASRVTGERGSFGGSQLAEDMGDYSGDR